MTAADKEPSPSCSTAATSLKSLQSFVNDQHIRAAQIHREFGAPEPYARSRVFLTGSKKIISRSRCAEQVEVASLIGDVATAPSGAPALHAHLVVGKRDGTAMAGHWDKRMSGPPWEVVLDGKPATSAQGDGPEDGLRAPYGWRTEMGTPQVVAGYWRFRRRGGSSHRARIACARWRMRIDPRGGRRRSHEVKREAEELGGTAVVVAPTPLMPTPSLPRPTDSRTRRLDRRLDQ